MSAANYPITIDQGSDFGFEFNIEEDGVRVDLTGYSVRAQMRASKESTDVAASFTCVISDPPNAVVNVSLSSSTSALVTAGIYYYDLEIYIANTDASTRYLEGKVTLTREVTR
jgi:hypothetical protein